MRARVRVVPQPEGPEGNGLEAARRAIETAVSPDLPKVVRRYRRGPSPLVRDSVRGWRCGRWERVLGGDFDLVR